MPALRRQQVRRNVRKLLALESLEARAMLAGNVTASVVKGTLLIRGDGEANEIVISQGSSAGIYTIAPLAGSTTTINGGPANAALNLPGVVRFDIKMLGGDDMVGIGNNVPFVGELFEAIADYPGDDGADEQQSGLFAVVDDGEEPLEDDAEITITTFLGGNDDDDDGFDLENPEFSQQQKAQWPTRVTGLTTVDLGDGDDTLVLMVRSTSNVNVEGGKGNDSVLSILTSVTNMRINTDPRRGEGMGDDLAAVVLANIRGDLAIATGAEDDGVLVLGATVTNMGIGAGGVLTAGMTDDDVVFVANVSAADNLGIQTEGGDDSVLVDTIAGDTFQISTGNDDDEVDIVGVALLNLLVDTAAGEDWVSISAGEDGYAPLVIRRNLGINTGADDDTVEIDGGLLGLYVGGMFDLRAGAGDDELLLEGVAVGRSATIDMEAGNDTAIVDNLDVRSDLTINMSAGNDVLSIRSLSATRKAVRGGTGNDLLHDLGDHQDEIGNSQFEQVDDGLI